MNGYDYIWLDRGNQTEQSIVDERGSDGLNRQKPAGLIAQAKNLSIEFRIIADSRAVEFDGFA